MFIPESMTAKEDRANAISFHSPKPILLQGNCLQLEFHLLSALWAECTCISVLVCVRVCVPTVPVATVSSVPHAARFMCLPLAKTKH